MALNRFCPHGNLRAACPECRNASLVAADARVAENRARGEIHRQSMREEPSLHYPWQRDAFAAWLDGGRAGLVALSPGLPMGDLPYAVVHHMLSMGGDGNALLVTSPEERDSVIATLGERFGLEAQTLLDHHFMEPRDDGIILVADVQELSTVDLSTWGRFATNGALILLDADSVVPALGHVLKEAPFSQRLCISRQPSAIDLLSSQAWSAAYGPLLYRYTEAQARDLGVLPRIKYRLRVAMLKPEPRDGGREGPWEDTDIPLHLPAMEAGVFARGRARDAAIQGCKETDGLVVIHQGVPIPGAAATITLDQLPSEYKDPPSGWFLADPVADSKAVMKVATTAWKTLGEAGLIEDAVVLPVAADLCRIPPWQDRWRQTAVQLDRVATGLLLSQDPDAAMDADDLEVLVGAALALRGIPAEELYNLTPVVAEAARLAHDGGNVEAAQVTKAGRSQGGLAAALLVAAEGGPASLLRLAHPRITPIVPDLPNPVLMDARRHAWRGRAFAALANAAARGDVATMWGRYPELRFIFPSSHLLEVATNYCKRHRLKGPLDDHEVQSVMDVTKVKTTGRAKAQGVLQEWADALGVAEEHERAYLADMHRRQPERERRREGMALPGLHVLNKNPSNLSLENRRGRMPATNIAPGSEVAIVEAGKRDELGRGIVTRLSGRHITIDFPAGLPRHLPNQITVNLVFDATVFEAYHSAILGAVRAAKTREGSDDGPDGLLRACLLGETKPPRAARQRFAIPALTESQNEAVEAVLSGGRATLVHGPPGTGKTHTLTHLAVALTKAGHSVLVTADSNAAVDNMVVGLRRAGAPVVRVGHAPNIRDPQALNARIDPNDAPRFVRWAAEQGVVVATTNYGAYRYIDQRGSSNPFIFDYVIHDEAGQSTAPSSLAAVMRGRRLVLAGDPLQLPPTVVSMDAKDAGLDVTLFERIEDLTGSDRTRMLRTQFRMRDEIAAFSNARYYEGRIETWQDAAEQETLDLPVMAFRHVTGRENPRQKNGSISNDYEVNCIEAILNEVRDDIRSKGWTVAVLTPYQAQREAIRRRIPDVEVSTVDGAQGREWDVVLYSSVRSNPRHRLGFLSDERRLNVAVTRARRNFVLVGDERTLRDHPGMKQLLGLATKIHISYGEAAPRPSEEKKHKGGGKQSRRRGKRGGPRGTNDGGPSHANQQGQAGQSGGGGRTEGDEKPKGRGRRRRRGKSRDQDSPDGDVSSDTDQSREAPEQPARKAKANATKVDAPANGESGSAKPTKDDKGKTKSSPKSKPSGGGGDAGRCTATTKAGSQCRLKAKANGRCGRHQA